VEKFFVAVIFDGKDFRNGLGLRLDQYLQKGNKSSKYFP
jgi:hypothetical protein